MSQHHTTRAFLFTAIVLLLASPFLFYDDRIRLTVFFIAAALIVHLGRTSRRDTRSLLTLSLNRIALAGLGLVAFWGSLNPLRSFTYDDAAENLAPWNKVYWYTVDTQDIVLWCGFAMAAIFFVVLLFGVIRHIVMHSHKTRSLKSTNV